MRICMHGFYHVQSCAKMCKIGQSWAKLGKMPRNLLKSLISLIYLIHLSVPLSEFPWNLLNYFEIPWNPLKSLENHWNPLKSHQIPLISLWTPSKPFKSLEISWNPLYTFDPCTWNTLKPFELPWRIWKPLKYWHTYKGNPCCTWMPPFEIPWDPLKPNKSTWNNLKSY